ncbi:hypothetical protein BJD99_18520 [Rhodococcus sp. 1163]|uniref:hypothetical protein n=1 Tax=Rhodococcus sp. 1163 TaxID=1905289 RepID=UPI000A001C62|nr:hypothetical protein [Rhodococcus sp. 1163]ORI18768.1 hypothetical protein BJD99_18520 [Rhodococcus sp. 1163]
MSHSSDITSDHLHARPIRVALDLNGQWTELTDSTPTSEMVRIQAEDLREAQNLRTRLRAEAVESGKDADEVAVFLDIEIHIADDARTARREFAGHDAPVVPASIRYIGTPVGLAGLIADVKAADVADGVTLIAAGPQEANFGKVAYGVVPWLEDRGVVFSASNVAGATGVRPASRVLAS